MDYMQPVPPPPRTQVATKQSVSLDKGGVGGGLLEDLQGKAGCDQCSVSRLATAFVFLPLQ